MPKNPSSESLVFAVDLGGTHLRVALVDDAGRILKQLKQETPKGDSAHCIINALVNAAQQWDSDKLPVVATSIMVRGAVDVAVETSGSVPALHQAIRATRFSQ